MKGRQFGWERLRMRTLMHRAEDEIRAESGRTHRPIDSKWICLCPDVRSLHLIDGPCPNLRRIDARPS